MKHHNGAPVLFSGVGMGIFLSAEFISLGKRWRSPASKYGCAISAGVLFVLALRLLSPADYLIAYQSPRRTGRGGARPRA
jgi:hypothetical protein